MQFVYEAFAYDLNIVMDMCLCVCKYVYIQT